MTRVNIEHTRNKIWQLDDLGMVLEQIKESGKKVVQCHGVFDLLHIGHIRHFSEARLFGDVLVVTITPDRFVNKGPGRPAFGEELRAEAVAALDCVDYVAINKWPNAENTIGIISPDYYVKGVEYQDEENDRTGGILLEKSAVESAGGELVFTNDITFSSSNLLNQYLPSSTNEARVYFKDVSSRYMAADILRYLDNARQQKVLIIGETIIDEYVYCDMLGKAGKEPILATKHVGSERFAGGVVAIANHVAAFCDQVDMLTFLGATDSQEAFVREKLSDSINPKFLYSDEGSPTIIKRRFVEAYRFQKLFELYLMDDGETKESESERLCHELRGILPNYDLVIVADYGHGMIGPDAMRLLCEQAKFLAVNTQVNAGNRGFNTISKYDRADFICISENEIQLDARSRQKDLREIVVDVSSRLCCNQIVVTQGENGSLCYDSPNDFFEIPALTTHVVDRIGAGDAVFSLASLCAAQKAPIEIAGLIGNAAGAAAVGTVGNRSAIERLPIIRHLEILLK